MTWLEYLGIEYLLNDKDGSSVEGYGAGLLLIVGIICWLLVAIFQGDLVDQGAVVFNMITTILLFILTIIKYIKALKYNKKSLITIIFYSVTLIILLISFILGLFIPCHSLFFNYEYKGIYSGISNIFYSLIILNILFPFFIEKVSFGKKIQEGMETIGLVLLSLVCLFFIGQIATLVVSFSGHTDFYQNFIQYHDLNITEPRKNWDYSDSKDFIEQVLPVSAKKMVDNYNENNTNQINYKETNDTGNFEKYSIIHTHETYPSESFKNNGLVFLNQKWIEDYIVYYKIVDKEYYDYFYVKFNYKEYKILDFVTKEEYDNARCQEN